MIKDRNSKDLTEAEEIKKRWQEYTDELHKSSLNDLHSQDSVVTHLEPDILECEVQWGLRSITMNKASGGDGIPAELFQILKDDAVKVLQVFSSKFGKLSSGHRTGKRQFSYESQRAMPKNIQTYRTIALISQASKVMLKILLARASAVHEQRISRCTSWV